MLVSIRFINSSEEWGIHVKEKIERWLSLGFWGTRALVFNWEQKKIVLLVFYVRDLKFQSDMWSYFQHSVSLSSFFSLPPFLPFLSFLAVTMKVLFAWWYDWQLWRIHKTYLFKFYMLTNQVSFIPCVYALYKHVCHRAYMEDNVQNLFSPSTM